MISKNECKYLKNVSIEYVYILMSFDIMNTEEKIKHIKSLDLKHESADNILFYAKFAISNELYDTFTLLFNTSSEHLDTIKINIPPQWKVKLIEDDIVSPEYFFVNDLYSQTIDYIRNFKPKPRSYGMITKCQNIVAQINPELIKYSQIQTDAMLLYSYNGDILLNMYIRNGYTLNSDIIEYYTVHYMWFAEFVGDFANDEFDFIDDYIMNLYNNLLSTFTLHYSESILLYRGIKDETHYIVGQKIKPIGFLSTTCKYSLASVFMKGKGTLFELTIPAGFNISPIYKYSRYPLEQEFLLSDHIVLTITNIVNNSSGSTIISADVSEDEKYKHGSMNRIYPLNPRIDLKHHEIQNLLNTSCIPSFFEWWKNTQDITTYTYTLDKCMYIPVLEWWANSGLEIRYTEVAMDFASYSGNIEVLDWWKIRALKMPLPLEQSLKYSINSMNVFDDETENHYLVLGWWKQLSIETGLPLKYTELAMYNCRIDITLLEWWKNSGLELKYDEKCIDEIGTDYVKHHVSLLNWWLKFSKETGLPMKYTEVEIDEIIKKYDSHKLPILMWWKQSGLELKYSQSSVPLLTQLSII